METIFTQISGKIKQTITGPTTERLLLIGTAVDGPLNKPFNITNYSTAESVFGPANYSNGYLDPITGVESSRPNGATIPLQIMQAIQQGCADIWVCRVSGNYAYAPSGSPFNGKLDIWSLNPGRIYNGVTLSIAQASGQILVTQTQPPVKGLVSFTTSYSSSISVSDLIDGINNNPKNATINIHSDTYPTYWYQSAWSALGTGSVSLIGGTNGTRAVGDDFGPDNADGVNGLAQLLVATDTGTFDVLLGSNIHFDVICLDSIYLDDQVVNGGSAASTTIAQDFVTYLDNASVQIGPCHGVMAVKPPNLRDDSSIIGYINNNLLNTNVGVYNSARRWNNAGAFAFNGFQRTDPVAGIKDLGGLLSVVAGPEVIFSHPDIGVYTALWHPTYAAALTTIPPENSMVGQSLSGISQYGIKFPKKYCDALVNGVGFNPNNDISGQGAYVVLIPDKTNINGPMVVYDDPTFSARDDYFRQQQLSHLVNSIMNNIDTGLRRFYGGPTNAQALAAMETVVTNIMEGYNSSGGVQGSKGSGYDFTISLEGNDAALGAIHVYLEINPSRALRKIYLTLAVRQPS